MCEHGDTVVTEAGGCMVDVDRCIAPLVEALNAAELRTVASCCGHGRRPGTVALADGREVLVLRSYEEARSLDALWPPISAPPPRTARNEGRGRMTPSLTGGAT